MQMSMVICNWDITDKLESHTAGELRFSLQTKHTPPERIKYSHHLITESKKSLQDTASLLRNITAGYRLCCTELSLTCAHIHQETTSDKIP